MVVDVDFFFVKDVNVDVVKDYDCLVAGVLTMVFGASTEMRKFPENLSGKNFSGKLAAAFAMQVHSRFSGSDVKDIEGKLKKLASSCCGSIGCLC